MIPTKPYAATDVGIFKFVDGKLMVYLVELTLEAYQGRLALPGTLVLETEELEAAVRRAYREATNQSIAYFEQVYTFSAIDRDPNRRVISTAYMAFPKKDEAFRPSSKYSSGAWHYVNDAPPLAYDHDHILNMCAKRIAAKLNYTTVALLLLPPEFTLADLQSVYEQGLGEALDKRNFRKKVLSMDIIEPTGRKRKSEQSRPAMLYKAVKRKMKMIPLF
jgi:8-oxo-dGTP diphosphatase